MFRRPEIKTKTNTRSDENVCDAEEYISGITLFSTTNDTQNAWGENLYSTALNKSRFPSL